MTSKLFAIKSGDQYRHVLATRLVGDTLDECELLAQAGFAPCTASPRVLVALLHVSHCETDPDEWDDRAMRAAHEHIRTCWDSLPSGTTIVLEQVQ